MAILIYLILEFVQFSHEFKSDMTVADIVDWNGVTPSTINCGRGN